MHKNETESGFVSLSKSPSNRIRAQNKSLVHVHMEADEEDDCGPKACVTFLSCWEKTSKHACAI